MSLSMLIDLKGCLTIFNKSIVIEKEIIRMTIIEKDMRGLLKEDLSNIKDIPQIQGEMTKVLDILRVQEAQEGTLITILEDTNKIQESMILREDMSLKVLIDMNRVQGDIKI